MIKLGEYINGNYIVKIYNDGTKIRETISKDDITFNSNFPENIDLKITNKCDLGCPMCHEKSTLEGLEGDILNAKFINSLKSFTELAIGGGNVLSHKDLIPFLKVLKKKNIIANITINQTHFEKNISIIDYLVKNNLIYGLGISLNNPNEKFLEEIKKFPNAVIHVINGIVTKEQLEKLYDKNLKLLFLGYKKFGRGNIYFRANSDKIDDNIRYLYDNIPKISRHFNTVSFDNLALKQLEINRFLTKKQWEEFFMGDDGSHTMYIDLVERKFAKNSTSIRRYELEDNIEDMFIKIKEEI